MCHSPGFFSFRPFRPPHSRTFDINTRICFWHRDLLLLGLGLRLLTTGRLVGSSLTARFCLMRELARAAIFPPSRLRGGGCRPSQNGPYYYSRLPWGAGAVRARARARANGKVKGSGWQGVGGWWAVGGREASATKYEGGLGWRRRRRRPPSSAGGSKAARETRGESTRGENQKPFFDEEGELRSQASAGESRYRSVRVS